jgi:TonB family protein
MDGLDSVLHGTVVAVLLASAVHAQHKPEFEDLHSWTRVRIVDANADPDSLVVRRGVLQTERMYSDFVLRFEYRLLDPQSEGRVLLRTRFGGRTGDVGFRVPLTQTTDGGDALGRAAGTGAGLKVVSFTPGTRSNPHDRWRECEIRAERDTLSVRIDGALVSAAEALDEFTGHIALEGRRGAGVEFRNVRVMRLPVAGEPFGQGALRADNEPGISAPRLVKSVKPFYPRSALDVHLDGVVELEAVVDATGAVGDIRVVKPLQADCDEIAIATARQWRFTPARKGGQPVPLIVRIEIAFRRD